MLYRFSHKKYAFQGDTEIEHIQVARWKNVLVIAFGILTMVLYYKEAVRLSAYADSYWKSFGVMVAYKRVISYGDMSLNPVVNQMTKMVYSFGYVYIRSEKDILKLVNTIIANTKGDGEKSGEDFWVKAERLLYCALIGYIYYEAPEEEQNFSTLLEFINASEAREDDEEFKNPVDELFEDLEKAKPEHFAVRQYKKYKLAAGDICSK